MILIFSIRIEVIMVTKIIQDKTSTLKKSVSILSISRVPSVGNPARGDIVPGTTISYYRKKIGIKRYKKKDISKVTT